MGTEEYPWLDEAAANAEIRRLRTVLRHYADPANWGRLPGVPEDESHRVYRQLGDGWEVAAAALAANPRQPRRPAPATPPASAPVIPLPSAATRSSREDQPA